MSEILQIPQKTNEEKIIEANNFIFEALASYAAKITYLKLPQDYYLMVLHSISDLLNAISRKRV